MVNRKTYSTEFKHNLAAQLVSGIRISELSQKTKISSQTLKRWKEEYLDGSDEDGLSKVELIELRKKNGELAMMLANALLEIDILKKTEKFLVAKKRNEFLSKPVSASSLGFRKVEKR